jgi:hypothetical protein
MPDKIWGGLKKLFPFLSEISSVPVETVQIFSKIPAHILTNGSCQIREQNDEVDIVSHLVDANNSVLTLNFGQTRKSEIRGPVISCLYATDQTVCNQILKNISRDIRFIVREMKGRVSWRDFREIQIYIVNPDNIESLCKFAKTQHTLGNLSKFSMN